MCNIRYTHIILVNYILRNDIVPSRSEVFKFIITKRTICVEIFICYLLHVRFFFCLCIQLNTEKIIFRCRFNTTMPDRYLHIVNI